MKFVRVLSRLALLLLAAAAFAGLTGFMEVQCGLLRQILSGRPGDGIVRPRQKSVSSQNSLVKVWWW